MEREQDWGGSLQTVVLLDHLETAKKGRRIRQGETPTLCRSDRANPAWFSGAKMPITGDWFWAERWPGSWTATILCSGLGGCPEEHGLTFCTVEDPRCSAARAVRCLASEQQVLFFFFLSWEVNCFPLWWSLLYINGNQSWLFIYIYIPALLSLPPLPPPFHPSRPLQSARLACLCLEQLPTSCWCYAWPCIDVSVISQFVPPSPSPPVVRKSVLYVGFSISKRRAGPHLLSCQSPDPLPVWSGSSSSKLSVGLSLGGGIRRGRLGHTAAPVAAFSVRAVSDIPLPLIYCLSSGPLAFSSHLCWSHWLTGDITQILDPQGSESPVTIPSIGTFQCTELGKEVPGWRCSRPWGQDIFSLCGSHMAHTLSPHSPLHCGIQNMHTFPYVFWPRSIKLKNFVKLQTQSLSL